MLVTFFRYLLLPLKWLLGFSRYPRCRRLVLYARGGIGDVIWHSPLLYAVTKRDGSVIFMTRKSTGVDQLLRGDPAIANLAWMPVPHRGMIAFFKMIFLLRRLGINECWLLQESTRYALIVFLAGIPRCYAYGKGLQKILCLPDMFVPSHLRHAPQQEKMRVFAKRAGLRLLSYEHSLPIASATLAKADKMIQTPKPQVVLGIGSSELCRQWGTEKYCELSRCLHEQYQASFLVFGGGAERQMVETIEGYAKQRDIPIYCDVGVSLDLVAAAIRNATFYVGNDTALMNIAAVASIPTIGLFSHFTMPPYSSYLYQVFPRELTSGIEGITVEDVLNAVRKVSRLYGTFHSEKNS